MAWLLFPEGASREEEEETTRKGLPPFCLFCAFCIGEVSGETLGEPSALRFPFLGGDPRLPPPEGGGGETEGSLPPCCLTTGVGVDGVVLSGKPGVFPGFPGFPELIPGLLRTVCFLGGPAPVPALKGNTGKGEERT